MKEDQISCECCIIGAGPAGLGAALELVKHGVTDILIVDKHQSVGGLARTDIFNGIRFDIGPHRFFTKQEEVNKIWRQALGNDFRPVSRLTRIYYKNKYFKYPIEPLNVLTGLGPWVALEVVLSLIYAQIAPRGKTISFQDWIVRKFGRKLYNIFFETYTEKIWGIPCDQIAAEWASQRIKGLDTWEIIKNYLTKKGTAKAKSLIKEFYYPVLGSGQMYEAIAEKVISSGARLMLGGQAVSFNHQDKAMQSIEIVQNNNERIKVAAKCFFSSIPLVDFFTMLNPLVSNPSVDKFRSRAHISVDLVISRTGLFADQWIYVHSPDVKAARIANYNNFSKAMLAGQDKTALSVEYFAFETDDLWKASSEAMVNLAANELVRLEIIKNLAEVEQGWVVRDAQAYPINYVGFQEHLDSLQATLDQFTNFYSIGRAGMHRYNNQDHSLLSGILAARNYLKLPGSPYTLWDINIDSEYQENVK